MKTTLIKLTLTDLQNIKSAIERQENYWFIEKHRLTIKGNTAQAEICEKIEKEYTDLILRIKEKIKEVMKK